MDIHEINPSSPMNKMELVYVDLDCHIVTNSPDVTDIEQEFFPPADGLFIEPSCSNISYDCILSSNHEYVLEDI
jgi:hypothetical protein